MNRIPRDQLPTSEAEWRERLTPEQYQVTRQAGTERAFTGEYWDCHEDGTYTCVCCGEPLFSSDTKFESGSGWPSFYTPVTEAAIEERSDGSHGMVRTEVRCDNCGAHLGHVFPDGPRPTGLRYCINSASLRLEASDANARGRRARGGSAEQRFVTPERLGVERDETDVEVAGPRSERAHGDLGREIARIPEDAGGDRREGDRARLPLPSRRRRNGGSTRPAASASPLFPPAPDRSDRVHDEAGGQCESRRQLGVAGRAAAQRPARGVELRPGRREDRAAHAAAPGEGGVGRVDDRVDRQRRDVRGNWPDLSAHRTNHPIISVGLSPSPCVAAERRAMMTRL